MQPTDAGRRIAINAVRERMRGRRLYDATALAAEAGINADTASDFLKGRRWPRVDTLAKIEQALKMPAGEIEALGAENAPVVLAQAGTSAKTLDEASEMELLMELLSRATARLGESA